MILVATQVVEQSLDLDFDLIISEIPRQSICCFKGLDGYTAMSGPIGPLRLPKSFTVLLPDQGRVRIWR